MSEAKDTGWSETSIDDHVHQCYCGDWLCQDESCEPVGLVLKRNYGWRECPLCEREDRR